jgi:group I intron endonuclease
VDGVLFGEFMASGIYEIRNIRNGHCYIGSSVNIEGRWNRHIRDLGRGKHHSTYLQRAWIKYGKDSFKFFVLESCSIWLLTTREQYFIDSISPEYNIYPMAGSPLGVKHSDQARANMSAAKRKMSAETRAKISMAARNISDDTRRKMSESKKNRTFSKEHRQKLSDAAKLRWSDKT